MPHGTDPLHWLVALCEQLVSAYEIVNVHGEPVWPALAGDTAACLRRLVLQSPSVEIRAVLDAAARHSSAVFADIGGLRIAAIDLRSAVGDELTLVVAERQAPLSRTASTDELTRVGRWLTKAVRRPMEPAADRSSQWHQLSLLHRILGDAAATGSDAAVVQALVDALAIWADTDTRAYRLSRSGEFVIEIALAGADPDPAPDVIGARWLPSLVGPTRLGALDAQRLGFRSGVEVIVETIEDGGSTPWLLAHLGTFSARVEERLALFSELLVPAVRRARAIELSRLVWSLTQELVGSRRPAPDAAAAALRVLGDATLATATLILRRVDGAHLMDLGDPMPPQRQPDARLPTLGLTLDLTAPFQARLTVSRADDRPFAVQEQRLVEAGAGVLASWLSSVLHRGELDQPRSPLVSVPSALDRRGHHRPIRRDEVSLLVIRPEATQSTREVRDLWVGRIGRRLRPCDVTGALPSGEIGVLLPETGPTDAHVVVERLRRVFREDHGLYLLERAPIGVATSRATASDVPTLLDQARADTVSAQQDSDRSLEC